MSAAQRVITATGAPVAFEVVDNIKDRVTKEALESLKKTGVGIKGAGGVGGSVCVCKFA